MNPVLIVIPILTVLMFDLGLELRPADFSLLRRSPRAVMVGPVRTDRAASCCGVGSDLGV